MTEVVANRTNQIDWINQSKNFSVGGRKLMMVGNRVIDLMGNLRAEQKRSLSIVVVIGDPTFETSISHIDDAVEAGVDMVELCIPSPTPNPYLESAALLASMKRSAVHYRGSFAPYFDTISQIRNKYPDLPIEAVCYQDVMNLMGVDNFSEALNQYGVDSALFSADMSTKPIETRRELSAIFSQNGILPIQFVPHPFKPARITELIEIAQGFIVVQTKAGSDGQRERVLPENRLILDTIRSGGIDMPLITSYGIRTPEHIRACIDLGADGVMIGSAVVDAGFRYSRDEYRALLKSYRQAASSSS